jgi:signal transduction histidine kinase/ActR/RegA family two-component response regulator
LTFDGTRRPRALVISVSSMEAPSGVWAHWRSDAFVRAGLVVAFALVALYTLPILSPDVLTIFDEWVVESLLLVGVLVALIRPGHKDRYEILRFWRAVTAAYLCWLAVLLLRHFQPETLENGPLWDSLHLLLYLCLAIAAEMGPHRQPGWSRSDLQHRFGLAGAGLCAFGLLTYFVYIPASMDAGAYGSMIPTYVLFVGLDLYVAVRFFVLMREARPGPWRMIFGLFAITAALWAVTDLLEQLNLSGTITIMRDSPLSLLWFPHFFTALLAVRLRSRTSAEHLTPDDESDIVEGDLRAQIVSGPLLAYAFVFPIAHISLYSIGLLGPATRLARESVVLVMLISLGGLALLQDLMQRKRARRLVDDLGRAHAELQRARRLEAVGQLAGGVAHGFNNLLTAIRGSVRLAREEIDRTEVARLCDSVDRAVDQAGSLTQQLLAVGRRQTLRPETVCLDRLVANSRDLLNGIVGRNIVLRVRLDGDGASVCVDPAQFNQVLLNLAANARDAMPQGGTLTVTTRMARFEDGDRVAGSKVKAGDYVALEAHDTGHGMDRATLDRIFEPFFTTKDERGGNGLGLATVYGIVNQSGGSIHVESVPGASTKFTVLLPRAGRRREDSPVGKAELPLREAAATVLVVDDEPAVREVVSAYLQREGYDVLTAGDGTEALNVCEGFPGPIDLLLTDVVMPEMGGPELARCLEAVRPATRVLFMSGYAPGALADEDGVRFLQKPFSRQRVIEEVEQILGTRTAVSAR